MNHSEATIWQPRMPGPLDEDGPDSTDGTWGPIPLMVSLKGSQASVANVDQYLYDSILVYLLPSSTSIIASMFTNDTSYLIVEFSSVLTANVITSWWESELILQSLSPKELIIFQGYEDGMLGTAFQGLINIQPTFIHGLFNRFGIVSKQLSIANTWFINS